MRTPPAAACRPPGVQESFFQNIHLRRGAAAAILFARFAWFVALVAYLRLSRGGPADGQDSAGA